MKGRAKVTSKGTAGSTAKYVDIIDAAGTWYC